MRQGFRSERMGRVFLYTFWKSKYECAVKLQKHIIIIFGSKRGLTPTSETYYMRNESEIHT